MNLEDINRLLADPRFMAEVLAGTSDEVLRALVEAEPSSLSPQQIDQAWARFQERLTPPEILLDRLRKGTLRLLGTASAQLERWALPAEQVREALLAIVRSRPAVATLGDGGPEAGRSSLRLMTQRKGEQIIEGRHCYPHLFWRSEGRVEGEIHVPLDQIGSLDDWKRGWYALVFKGNAYIGPFENRADDALRFAIERPAPKPGVPMDLPLSPDELEVQLIREG
jgi:hypothetical protein